MASLPTGTVTFLFTDIEGSTHLLQHLGDSGYARALAEHRRLLRAAFEAGGGHELETQGDGFLVVFQQATNAVAAAVSAQRALNAHPWPDGAVLRVRMGLHSGEPLSAAEGYVGLDVHRAARICSAGYGGQILISQRTRDLIEHGLPGAAGLRDLGLHRLKDLQRPEKVFQIVPPDLPSDFPPLKSLDARTHNLPVQLSSFVGREREIAQVKQLLSSNRLLTLTGSGGCGKTRLALQVAADLVDEFADGVWLVELAPLADPALVPNAVASVLGVREQAGRPLLATLSDYLQPKRLLLVLDNCEHLIGAVAQLAGALVSACPPLSILATSREPLGIAGERTWRVPSLSVPDPHQQQPPEMLARSEAVRLFVERAASALPDFAVTSGNAPAVAQVCHRLDGIPLAIELAAARVKVLPVTQIAARLDDRFRLLTGGSRTALPRQQTLRAALDWSYDLLLDAERVLLRRLSVFAGGFTLEAAEAVCAGEGVEESGVLDLLTHLVDKSLVVVEDQGSDVRYRLLETVRQYGRERLLESGEAYGVHRRHRDWYLGLAGRAEPELQGPEQVAWLERLETEHENLRAALEWSKMAEGAEAGLRLAGALWQFWDAHGHFTEGREWLEEMLSRSGAPPALRAKALHGAAGLAVRQGDYERAAALCQESLALYRELGDRRGMANALNGLGIVAHEQGDHAAARALYEEQLAIRRELGDTRGVGAALNNLGLVARDRGDYAAARVMYEESLAIHREMGDKRLIAYALNNLGFVVSMQGDNAAARPLHEESLALFRQLGDKRGIAHALNGLALVAGDQDDYAAARAYAEESLAIRREVGDRRGMAYALSSLGSVARDQGDHAAARALYEEGLAIRRELGDVHGIAHSLFGLGVVARDQCDYGTALALHEESLALQRTLGDKHGTAYSLSGLGLVAHDQGDDKKAHTLHEESLALFREVGDKRGIASALNGLGLVARDQGDDETARSLLQESLAAFRDMGARGAAASALNALASVALRQGDLERAGRLFGAAEALREAIGAPLPPSNREEYDRAVASARAGPGAEAFAAAWAQGRAMRLQEAVEDAMTNA